MRRVFTKSHSQRGFELEPGASQQRVTSPPAEQSRALPNGTRLRHVRERCVVVVLHQLSRRLPRPPKMRVPLWPLAAVTHVWMVNANVEKTIFLGPAAVQIPNDHPTLEDLRLDVLEPIHAPILETLLAVQFPTKPAPRGLESWYLLRGLEEGRRYEVRICWPATVGSSVSSMSIVQQWGLRLLLLYCHCMNETNANTIDSPPLTFGWIPILLPRFSTPPT